MDVQRGIIVVVNLVLEGIILAVLASHREYLEVGNAEFSNSSWC